MVQLLVPTLSGDQLYVRDIPELTIILLPKYEGALEVYGLPSVILEQQHLPGPGDT